LLALPLGGPRARNGGGHGAFPLAVLQISGRSASTLSVGSRKVATRRSAEELILRLGGGLLAEDRLMLDGDGQGSGNEGGSLNRFAVHGPRGGGHLFQEALIAGAVPRPDRDLRPRLASPPRRPIAAHVSGRAVAQLMDLHGALQDL